MKLRKTSMKIVHTDSITEEINNRLQELNHIIQLIKISEEQNFGDKTITK